MAIGLTLNELYTCNKSLEPNNKDNKNGVNNINHKYQLGYITPAISSHSYIYIHLLKQTHGKNERK